MRLSHLHLRDQTFPTTSADPYLTEIQASELATDVLRKYESLAGVLPGRIVIHKTSDYQPEEETGFRAALQSDVSKKTKPRQRWHIRRSLVSAI
jgi:hypothetical protein